METWCRTFTGKKFDPFRIRMEDIDILDIAHALSMQCRYNGMVSEFYSVAQHCVIVSQLCEEDGLAIEGLLHDASEAYLGDLISPLKRRLREYSAIEDVVHRAIEQKFTLDPMVFEHPVIKLMDRSILVAECDKLMPPDSILDEGEMTYVSNLIECWDPPRAKAAFLARFYSIKGSEVKINA